MQLYPDEGIRPDPATYPHGDFGCHLRMGPRRIPIRLRIRTAIPFPIRAGEGIRRPGSHGMASAPHFSAGNRRGPGGPLRMAFHPHFPGRGPPEKRSLRGSWRQTTRSFAKEPAVNISIATDAAGSALPSKGKKKVRQSDPLPAASFTLRSPPPAPFPARPKKFGPRCLCKILHRVQGAQSSGDGTALRPLLFTHILGPHQNSPLPRIFSVSRTYYE